MAITYDINQKRDARTGKLTYYPVRKGTHPLSFNSFCERIAHATSLTRADAAAVLIEAVDQLKMCLLESQSVELGEMGTIFTTLTSTGADAADDVSPDNIRGVRLHCKFKKNFKNYFQPEAKNVCFKKITPQN